MHFQKLFLQHSVFTICRFFLIHYQIRQIIISMHCVAQSITFFINMLFHRLISPFLCSLFYFSYVAGSPSHFFWHPKPIFREYFLWAFAPLAVFLLILSAPVYLSVPHTLFTLEDLYGLNINEIDGELCLRLDKSKGTIYLSMFDMFHAWQEQAEKLKSGEITQEEYDQWRYNYPKNCK